MHGKCMGLEQKLQSEQEPAKPTVLALYNLEAKIKVCSDASTFELGTMLLQQQQSVETCYLCFVHLE